MSSEALEQFILTRAGAQRVAVTTLQRLGSGSIHDNWVLDAEIQGGPFAGHLAAVLRADAPTDMPFSRSKAEEFAVLKAAFDAGVTAPQPLWLCEDVAVFGRPFFIMRRLPGMAAGHRIIKDQSLGGDRDRLVERLGAELAKIHSIRPARGNLGFLKVPEPSPAIKSVTFYRDCLDKQPTPRPALEWALRWLERHAPPPKRVALCHGDYRTGNYVLDTQGLRGIIDWEFAHYSDPLADIGWFCAKCWRFGVNDKEAGGIGHRDDFYRGYERLGGRAIDRQQVHYWEVMAHVRFAIIAIMQAQRHLSGAQSSLELALTGYVVPQLEWEALQMTEAEDA
jgi:aminoglycoside phosphotransferase (APT) family kinase protein